MGAVVLVGTQWGDEGKGKITDYLAREADVIVRYQGGSNAGHTVVVGDREYRLHLIPSGILYPGKTCIIGNGVVLDIEVLSQELDNLNTRDVGTDSLKISDRAHLVLPYHRLLDELEESIRGSAKIGTTRQGVGPAYMDKSARSGLRTVDMLNEERFVRLIHEAVDMKNRMVESVYGRPAINAEEVADRWLELSRRIRPFICDTSVEINRAIAEGKRVLFEGAQGTLLDLDFGTYPYVTSSHPIAGGACIGSGVGPTRIDRVIGVAKAYTSRVGDGPFPTEETGPVGAWIRERGAEYGTRTGRPRRCGWLDMVILKHAARVSGLDGLVLTRLDVLSGLDEIKVCTHYRCDSGTMEGFPADLDLLARSEPVYETFPGWTEDLSGIEDLDQLPANARRYLKAVEELSGIPLFVVSIGRERKQTISVRSVFD